MFTDYIPFLIAFAVLIIAFFVAFVVKRGRVNYYALAKTALEKGNLEYAIKVYKRILITNKNNPTALYYIGIAYEKKNMLGNAVKYFQAVFQKAHYNKEVTNRKVFAALARIYLLMKNYKGSLEMQFLLKKVSPEDPDIYYSIGYIYYLIEDYEKAKPGFIRAVDLKTSEQMAFVYLGICLYREGGYLKAMEYLEPVLTADRNIKSPFAYFCLGDIYSTVNRHAEAIEFFNLSHEKGCTIWSKLKVGDGASNNRDTIDHYERILGNITDIEKNLIEINKFRYIIADLFVRRNFIPKAIEYLEEIVRNDPDFKNANEILSRFQREEETKKTEEKDKVTRLLTISVEKFKTICEKFATYQKHDVREMKLTENGTVQLYTVFKDNRIKADALVEFDRMSNVIGEITIREFIDSMKNKRVHKGIFVTPSTFSSGAVTLAQTRAIDLIEGEKFKKILEKIPF